MKKNRQPLAKHPAVRILIIWVIQALALLALTFLLRGLWVDSLGVAFAAAAVIGLLNALLWPLLSYILLPFAVFTLGFLTLVLNGAVIWLAGRIVDGFYVDNLWTAILAAFNLAEGTSYDVWSVNTEEVYLEEGELVDALLDVDLVR